MKRFIAAAITVLVLALALWASRGRAPQSAARIDVAPEDCIQRMFAAAEQGDVAAYLDCFSGDERRRLERELGDQSREAFARSLQQAVKDMKGRAVFAAAAADAIGPEVRLTVERIYANRTEQQVYRLIRDADLWRISGVQLTQAYQPANPYGTPVLEAVPEEAASAP